MRTIGGSVEALRGTERKTAKICQVEIRRNCSCGHADVWPEVHCGSVMPEGLEEIDCRSPSRKV